MRLTRVMIRQFRNIAAADLIIQPGLNLWAGPNGQGKTNGLHALASAVAPLPPLSWEDMVQWGAEWADVRAEWTTTETSRLTVRLTPKRTRRREGPLRPLVWFSPHDLSLVQGGPLHRRRFLDEVASALYPRYPRALAAYERALKQRNRGLKEEWPDAALESFTALMVDSGLLIWSFRAEVVGLLEPWLTRAHQALADQAEVRLALATGHLGADLPVDAAAYRAQLETVRIIERARRISLIGPHRDDLVIDLGGRSAQKFGSQGEQRTIALGLRLATFETLREEQGEAPLVLLDDVLSELDPHRRELLLALIASRDQQTIVTDTEVRHFQAFAEGIYEVRGGAFVPWT